jgi:hypothetical protein
MAPPAGSPANPLESRSGLPAGPVTGPQFPMGAPPGRPSIHSELVDPVTSTPAGAATGTTGSNWANNWNVQTGSPPAGNDRFNLPPITGDPNGAVGKLGPERAGNVAAGASGGTNSSWPFATNSQSAPPPPLPTTAQNNAARPAATEQPAITTGATGGRAAAANTNTNVESKSPPADQPWMPLVFAILTLIGSVSANLFLGWSYLDARQKYQTLVRKTADKFRRAAEAA